MPEEIVLIQPAPVVRDEYGMFAHPDMPDFDEGDGDKCKAWIAAQGLQVKMVHLEYHSDEAVSERYFEAGDPDCSYWEPDRPDGDGWFCLAIHDTDDGPLKQLRPMFDEAPIDSITPFNIAGYRDARSAKVRAKREIALLSHVFNMARE